MENVSGWDGGVSGYNFTKSSRHELGFELYRHQSICYHVYILMVHILLLSEQAMRRTHPGFQGKPREEIVQVHWG